MQGKINRKWEFSGNFAGISREFLGKMSGENLTRHTL